MKTKLKRTISVLLSCTVLVFSCIFIPHQKAEAGLLLAGGLALGTAVAIGLIGYGIGVSSDDPEEDTYLAMACDKLTEYAAGQGINKWNLNHYLTNATWFWTAMAEVASWFYEQNLVFNETYEPLISSTSYLDGAAAGVLDLDSRLSQTVTLSDGNRVSLFLEVDSSGANDFYFFLDASNQLHFISTVSYPRSYFHAQNTTTWSGEYYYITIQNQAYNGYCYNTLDDIDESSVGFTWSKIEALKYLGLSLVPCTDAEYTVYDFIDSLVIGEVEPTSPGISVDFPQRLFESPADVLDITGSMESYKIDSTKDVIDFGNAEELTELKTFDATLDKVLSGELTADQVITAVGAQPYVLTDAETGEIATTDTPAENVKPVALEGDLSIPQDLVAEDTYTPTNTSTDTDKPKNRFNFPLSEFFPFCLPFDLYDFLTFFVADPVAPVFELDLSTMFSADPDIYDPESDYSITIDLSKFDEVAELLRIIETIGIIVGFVMVSRKLIHGGN